MSEVERSRIINLFRQKGLRPGEEYPLAEFLAQIDFDGDPAVSSARREAFSQLVAEGRLVEMNNSVVLTEKGYAVAAEGAGSDIATAIDRLRETLVTAGNAELAHLRDINGTLTGIMSSLEQLTRQMDQVLARAGESK